MKNPLLPLLFTCSLLVAACSGEPTDASGKTPPPPTPEVVARLAKADAADGATDKVVHKCAGCKLGMDGQADKELAVGEYKMHFCSDACLDSFRADPNGQAMAKLPQ